MKKISKLTAMLLTAAICLAMLISGCNAADVSTPGADPEDSEYLDNAVKSLEGTPISNEVISTNNFKNKNYNNPISSEFHCADPTAVEYNGRLYVFGTNDHQQFETAGPDVDNTYEKIKSFVVLSTDDMVNWTYHGEINVGEIAPWITNSWAPSIVSRVEDDGLTHFYLYFSNNGLGVGVLTATDPLGPWEDPLGEPLISSSTPGLTGCPNPFDPGVVIDDNGDGWLSFGGGKAPGGTEYMPGSARIVKLGDDMLSFASEFCEIPAPYFFEASELNYINGTYVYTYNTDWSDHSAQWDYDCAAPTMCSMVYMTTEDPLDPESWEMRGEYFKNPGLAGFDYSNNHTHLHKFNGEYYIFYHTMMLKNGMGITGAYRSLGVDVINVDENTLTIESIGGTKNGVSSICPVDPFSKNAAAELNGTADITFDTTDMSAPVVVSDNSGSWISVRDVQFTEAEAGASIQTTVEYEQTAVNSIQYNITVTSIDKAAVLSMYPSAKGGADCAGSIEITEAGKYTVTCDLGGAVMMQNLGYFALDNDAQITLTVESVVINEKYELPVASELTNTREWANGLKNIWSGVADGEEVYSSDSAVFKYIGSDDAIEFFIISAVEAEGSAPVVDGKMTFYADVKGTGRIEVRLGSPTGELLTSVDYDSADEFITVYNDETAQIGGTHDLYFVFSEQNMELRSWQFAVEN